MYNHYYSAFVMNIHWVSLCVLLIVPLQGNWWLTDKGSDCWVSEVNSFEVH